MWEESTCLRFRENMQARDAIRYVLERGDSCFTEYIGRNGGFQDIIIGSECGEVRFASNFKSIPSVHMPCVRHRSRPVLLQAGASKSVWICDLHLEARMFVGDPRN